ncbi:hypothetical protein EDM59_19575 [Brevibacillus nitrificans]|uniref:DUF5317 domain-containing protein n=1 Tax=Brevibacillus nitrificans TaxID=651560 RepID=A0A3M8D7J4_9BACL|nr:DUF5317 domain-containing protein [Brevibacillus nitrificans]RNB83235.1 hypothetical protein EDM59_19575 [Brevibacillus nitrificans]
MLFELWMVSIGLALSLGGRFQHLNQAHIRYPVILILCFIVYLFGFLFYDVPHVKAISAILYQGVLFSLLIFLFLNVNTIGFPLILAGFLLNLIVIVTNDGVMPVNERGIILAGLSEQLQLLRQGDGKHVLMDQHSKLWFLGDFIPLPRPYGMRQVISLGDFILSIGVTRFLYCLLLNTEKDKGKEKKEEKAVQ